MFSYGGYKGGQSPEYLRRDHPHFAMQSRQALTDWVKSLPSPFFPLGISFAALKRKRGFHMTINSKTSYKELKALVGNTKKLDKFPTEKALRESEEEIVFDGDAAGAHFTIYQNGLFIYSRGRHATVYAVDRCGEIEYPCVYADEGGVNVTAGCKHRVKTGRDGQKHLIMIVPETEYMDGSWVMPLDVVGSHRLDHNADSREESHSDFSLNNDGADWESKAEEQEEELRRKLEEAKKKLADKQREVIQHAFYEDPNQTQAEMAKKMNCSQPMVHKHLDAALKNLRKNMGL